MKNVLFSHRMIMLFLIFILMASNCIFINAQNASAPQRFVPPMLKNGKLAAYITFNRPLITQAMIMNNPEGVTYTEDVYLGSNGIKSAPESKEPYFYFQTAKDDLVNSTGTFYVSVQYLDLGQSSIELEYYEQVNKDEEPTVQSQRIFLGNSGFWEEHTFTIQNAIFDQLFENKNDIRLFCPDVLIRHISISRVPLGKPKTQQFDTFRQPAINKPPGYSFSVHITNNAAKSLIEEPSKVPGMVQLYQSWGASYIVETVDINELFHEDAAGETNPVIQRAAALQQHGISWAPRFKIGDVNQLPLKERDELQHAKAAERNIAGPMISLWEPKLKTVYADIFTVLKRKAGLVNIPKLTLSFAGDQGPLFLSTEQSGGITPAYWIADPLAAKSFVQFLRLRYGSTGILSTVWNAGFNSWEDAVGMAAANSNPTAKQDLMIWYQQSLLQLMEGIIQSARISFPQAVIEIEIGDEYPYSATDFSGVAHTAARNGCSLVMDVEDEVPAQSYSWLMMAATAHRLGVPFGLRIERNPTSSSLISAVYSLASEGGTILHFDEETVKPQNAWNMFSSSVGSLSSTSPNQQVAVIFPRSSAAAADDFTFKRMVQELRERMPFDVIDESDLNTINPSQYPVVIVPWGHIWQAQSLERFESLARAGCALIVKMNEAWQTPQMDRTINERIFAGQLEQKNGKWTMVPRTNSAVMTDTNSLAPSDSRNLYIGSADDQKFLSGKWSAAENQLSARQYGFPFESFRWFRERAVTTLPVIPNRDYELQIDGYVADRHPVDVYVNNNKTGTISGNGAVKWKMDLTGSQRPRQPNVQVMLRGQEWNTGTVLGSAKPATVTMAVSRIALQPKGQDASSQSLPPNAATFQREQLRGTFLREVGRGVTLVMPGARTNDWMFYELITTIMANPKILDPRYNFQSPPDGEVNRVFVSRQSGLNLYLNLNDTEKIAGNNPNQPKVRIPPNSLYYSY